MTLEQKVRLAVAFLVIVVSGGTAGYMNIEGWTFLESLYMTIITVSTVGFKEVGDLSSLGRVFTLILIVLSISMLAYCVTVISSFILEGHFREIGRKRKMEVKIGKVKNHYIVCGEGKVAEQIVEEFQAMGILFVIITRDFESFGKYLKPTSAKRAVNLLYLEGEPTKDEVLKEAGVERAKGLLTCLDSDTDNLFVTLSARSLNPQLKIVAQAKEEISQGKMMKAGANNVISPYVIGGRRMASVILRPTVVSFLDIIMRGEKDVALRLEEIAIPSPSPLAGKSISEAEIRRQTETLVVAIKDEKTGKVVYNPPPSSILKEKDVILVLGEEKGVNKLRNLCKCPDGKV